MQTAGISAELLTPSSRNRFAPLYGVASRKSVLPWKEVPRERAQLIVLDQGMADAISSLGKAPCVVCIGQVKTAMLDGASWVGRLEADYTLSDLIDMFDRAAVFLLDWDARNKVIRQESVQAAAQPAPTTRQEFRYQLKSWVSVGAPFNTGACIRALALLSREPVSIVQLCLHSGLDNTVARGLLVELGRRGVLRGVAMPVISAASSPSHHREPLHSKGLLSRLGRWIRGGGKPG
ncbi:hypothetical protein [Comamonas sp. MYb69]|uniref:hypothetical protein n=1 Tax=Comamonas sp. MYb69 TaxID=1848650 RepID=UPI0030AA237E